MSLPSNPYNLSDDTYRQITDLIYSASGLRFDRTSKSMIHRRLAERLQSLQLDSFEKYYLYLRHHPNREAEFDRIYDLIATHETYFFREEGQLKAFSEEIIPELTESPKHARTLKIWCAGCASGEEPYTIAILCRRHSELKGWKVDIFASDISQKMIRDSRRGIYGESSFRSTSEEIKESCFDQLENHRYRIHDDIKQMVTFMKVNLLDDERISLLGEMDVIFCRNVIIYFDAKAKRKIIETFHQKLRPGGYLLLGHAESLVALSTQFHLVHLKNDMVYQK